MVTGMPRAMLSPPAAQSLAGREGKGASFYGMTTSPLIGLSIDFVVLLSEVITRTSKDRPFAWPLSTPNIHLHGLKIVNQF